MKWRRSRRPFWRSARIREAGASPFRNWLPHAIPFQGSAGLCRNLPGRVGHALVIAAAAVFLGRSWILRSLCPGLLPLMVADSENPSAGGTPAAGHDLPGPRLAVSGVF